MKTPILISTVLAAGLLAGGAGGFYLAGKHYDRDLQAHQAEARRHLDTAFALADRGTSIAKGLLEDYTASSGNFHEAVKEAGDNLDLAKKYLDERNQARAQRDQAQGETAYWRNRALTGAR